MYRTILVPLDDSGLAERALPYADVVAQRSGARLLLARVVQAAPCVTPACVHTAAVREAEAALSASVARLRTKSPVETAVFIGDETEAIVREILLRRVDLVVMAVDCSAEFSRSTRCGLLDELVRRTQVPALVIHQSCPPQWQIAASPAVLVPLDGSFRLEAALAPAGDLADALNGELVLLHIPTCRARVESGVPRGLAHGTATETAARDYLDAIASKVRTTRRSVTTLAHVGPPDRALRAIANEHGVATIALVTHRTAERVALAPERTVCDLTQSVPAPFLLVPAPRAPLITCASPQS